MSTDLYGDVDPEIENRRTTYYNERFWQLNSLVISGSEKTWNYLLTVNGGGCVAILTLIGAISDYRKLSWPYWVLALFVLGLSLVGVFHAFWAHKTNSLLEGWKADSWSYWQRNITWDENTKRDKGRVNSWSTFPWLLGWCICMLFNSRISSCLQFKQPNLRLLRKVVRCLETFFSPHGELLYFCLLKRK